MAPTFLTPADQTAAMEALYLFAGVECKSDVGPVLRRLGWEVVELDTLRSQRQDLSKTAAREKIWLQICSIGFQYTGISSARFLHSRYVRKQTWTSAVADCRVKEGVLIG